jgi:hypothetical protein
MIVLSTLLVSPVPALADPDTTNCLYPTPADRFGITVYNDDDITAYDLTPLGASSYLNWAAKPTPAHPNAMNYYFMVRVNQRGHTPAASDLQEIAANNPGGIWIIGNEADVVWQDNATPDAYAQAFYSAYTAIKAGDPTARFVMNGVAQVSPLRLAWLDQVWDSYYANYGVEIPVDIWNIHTYIANEMHLEWGAEVPPGIDNAVGYSEQLGTQWTQLTVAGASGGTVHQSRTLGARAYFAFHGDRVTVFLRSGPDAGIAEIYLDQSATPAGTVDLYAPTPGTVSRTYSGLPAPGGIREDRHNIRVQVTGQRNPASSGTWIRVDAMEAPSTAGLPNGRFEDDSPLRARTVTSIDDHDNLQLITQQIRDFRQWMLARGQRNKPLINTEHGILMTEDLGFTYPRVRTFMLNSFDLFLNDLIDPALGYPQDGNRLLQEWLWFALGVESFEGRATNTGLYNADTRIIKPLGIDFSNYVQPLRQDYVDLEVTATTVTPYWPIFAGDLSLLRIDSIVRNRGNLASGPFDVKFRAGSNALLATQSFASLPKRYDPGYRVQVTHDWLVTMPGPRGVRVIADESNLIAEPCQPNNETYTQVTPPPGTDLALSNLRTDPALLPPVHPTATTTVTLQVDLRNLGAVGTSASQVQVKFWSGNPNAGGTLIGAQTLTPGSVALPATISLQWPDRGPGWYTIYARVEPAPEETNIQNNTQQMTVLVPGSVRQFPLVNMRYRMPRPADDPAARHPFWRDLLPAEHLPANGQ